MNKSTRLEMFRRFEQNDPNPQTELSYHNEFELLIAVILSAQATDISVNKATVKLFKVANTPQAILLLGKENLIDYIKQIGLFRSKANNIIACCQKLVTEFSSQVPKNREQLESLAGVGRKTANVILNTLYGAKTIAVDTHVFRVANRTGLAKGKTVREVETKLLKNVPPQYVDRAHNWLVLHGRYICKAQKPSCERCFLNDLCDYYAIHY